MCHIQNLTFLYAISPEITPFIYKFTKNNNVYLNKGVGRVGLRASNVFVLFVFAIYLHGCEITCRLF